MRSKVYTVELFIDNLLDGTVEINLAEEVISSWVKGLNNWARLRATAFDSTEFSDETERIYNHILEGRMQRWLRGRFEEKEYESKVAELEAQVKKVTEERDLCIKQLADLQLPPEKKSFPAFK